MIRMKGAARTPSCFAVAGPPAVPGRKTASLAVPAGAYVTSLQRSQVRPVFATGRAAYSDSTKSALDRSCTWPVRGPVFRGSTRPGSSTRSNAPNEAENFRG